RTLPVGHIVTPEAVTYVKVIVGSASSRTLPVGHIVTPEAVTYVSAFLGRSHCHAGGGDLRERLLRCQRRPAAAGIGEKAERGQKHAAASGVYRWSNRSA
ncbi:MAG TPA: hypothetical protein GX400_14135, partial [Chloroflexi bacterium]|nr:hypothetical protein [Chloroflexota bacterium]